MQLPNRASVEDPFPGMCSVCKQGTSNPYTMVLYTASMKMIEESQKVTCVYSDFLEHPLRICDSCMEINGNLGKMIVIALVAAIPFAIFIGNVFEDENPVCSGLIGGIILFVGILAFTYDSADSIRRGRQGRNLRKYREDISNSSDMSYSVFDEERFLELRKTNIGF
mgnify:CR=1 FL=1